MKKVVKKTVKKAVKKAVKKKAVKKPPEKISGWLCRDPRGVLLYQKEPKLSPLGQFDHGGKLLASWTPGKFEKKYPKQALKPGNKRSETLVV